MEAFCIVLVAFSTLLWVGFALLPWRPWSNREVLDAMEDVNGDLALDEITVLIPARNEAEVIQRTLQSVIEQGPGVRIVLIDDNSEDATVEKARQMRISDLRIIRSLPLPPGWSGKLWALEQGRLQVTTPYTLLLDADIELGRGIVKTIREKMDREGIPFVSLMAAPSMSSGWEKMLMPAFVHFFKVLYPFGRVNSRRTRVAAAAGGCILVETEMLDQIGGFESIKSAVIDDCALARRVKLRRIQGLVGADPFGEECPDLSTPARNLGHGSAHGVYPAPLLRGAVDSVHIGDAAGVSGSCRYGCFREYPDPLSCPRFVSDHVPNLRAHPSILSSIMGVGTRSAFDRRDFFSP